MSTTNAGMAAKSEYFDQTFGGGGAAGKDNPPPAHLPEMVHGWLLERCTEGDRVNRADPSFRRADDLVSDLMGEQPTGQHSSPAHQVVFNQTRKAINVHASILTDLKPLWEWRTHNELLKTPASIINDLLVTWWLQSYADLELADAVRYAATIGSSDVVFEWDQSFLGGDMRMIARDWRDTLPIRPERSRSVQDWEGVTLREAHSSTRLRRVYPQLGEGQLESTGLMEGVYTKVRRIMRPEGQTTTLSGLGAKDPNRRYTATAAQPEITLFRTFCRDTSINKTQYRVLMGAPGRAWSYFVDPGKPLYPRGRCIVWVEGKAFPLYDGPNPYWHSKWPVARLSLQRWPWLMTGMPLAYDMRPLQRMLNTTMNDFMQTFSQWVNRGSVWGKNAPNSIYQRFDPAKPNWKVKVNTLVGTGFQLQEGPQLPPWSFQFLVFLFQKWDELAGVANLQQLLNLRQAPGRETIEKFLEAMTPELRLEARQIEAFLREIADMFLPNVAQFYSTARRLMKLGSAGQTLADVDYDPGTIIPAMRPDDPGYVPELDASLPRDVRAQWWTKQFAFFVAPSSILALHAQERQLKYLQLSRQGYLDFWTLGEMLEIPNLGSPPPVLLPRTDVDPKQVPVDPATNQPQLPMEVRIPQTVTERLIAQAQLGIGQTVSPAGRKATGQQPPEVKQRSDGSTAVSESG